MAVARLIVKWLLSDEDPVMAAVDGTFFRRWGRKVYQAQWAYDGTAQGGKKVAFGNIWVVAALVVQLPYHRCLTQKHEYGMSARRLVQYRAAW